MQKRKKSAYGSRKYFRSANIHRRHNRYDRNAETGALENFNFEQLQKHVPELNKFSFPIDTYQFDPPMDSSDMDPEAWCRLVRIISDNYNRYTGFVILHGTDTMAYTASALSFMLEGLDKPVILTGSQLPIGVLRTDGKENLMTSIEIATAHHPSGRPIVPEVCIFFENHLMRGNRTTKINAEDFNAFRSFNYPVLASAGIHIKYNNVQIHTTPQYNRLNPHYLLDTNITILKLFPGIRENVIDAVLSIPGLKAVVLETYGSGNAPVKTGSCDACTMPANKALSSSTSPSAMPAPLRWNATKPATA